jgi:Domain of unknown function (DUF6321)
MSNPKARNSPKPPWERERPKRPRKRLSAAARKAARASAQRAGRPYPNLVDNIKAARTSKPRKRRTKRTTNESASGKRTKRPTNKSPGRRRRPRAQAKPKRRSTKAQDLRSPRGGLSAAGRAFYARKEGAHLRPGVSKPPAKMTAEDMRRKGSWARRFYGRKQLPALRDASGKPTRFALTAAAWGEPVPRTVAAAREIAKKGKALLKEANRTGKRG